MSHTITIPFTRAYSMWRDQRSITGLETAIVLIAFAVQDLESQSGGGSVGLLPSLPALNPQDMPMLSNLTLVALISLTISNALALKFALGGHPINVLLFGAITCTMTGLNMLLLPPIAGKILLSGSV